FLERYGRLIDSLGGIFSTGEDLGTTPEDFAVIARQTRHIHGFDPDSGQKIDPGPFTARGVFAGMRAAAEEVFGGGLADRVVLIQGVGHVGRRLAEMLRREGARVLLCDIDEELARRVAEEIGGETVRADRVYDTPCDIYSPCAIGSTLNEETIPRLSCRLVAGSANNQLATEADADRLHRREIVYAPDFVINGGGAMAFGLLANGETDTAAILQRMDDVGSTIGEIFREASANDESPLDAANRRVRRVLERGA
ncbi:MAG: Glu/Leu/Phe/Val dehydrogenase family protein, partial [Thermoanaerobaculia bacterium]|nr:Glu/Leu/Phe/Val dehydrogenase family protein [Thermoanaerobaculia bacterium]